MNWKTGKFISIFSQRKIDTEILVLSLIAILLSLFACKNTCYEVKGQSHIRLQSNRMFCSSENIAINLAMLLANCFEQIVIKTRKLQLSFSQVPITYAITSSSMLSQDNNKSKGLISCLPLDKLKVNWNI